MGDGWEDGWVCWRLAGEIVGVVFPAEGPVSWKEGLHACIDEFWRC